MKDNFSKQSDLYAKFRPGYPPELVKEIVNLCKEKEIAWDCGTGNGQFAKLLSPHFRKVIATDISRQQLNNAEKAENITYKKEPAESSSLEADSIDMVTVALAIHWFNFEEFYKEVRRVCKKDGIIAVLGYSLIYTNSLLDRIINEFYTDVVGPYWDPERKWIHEGYQTIPFPFKEISIQNYTMSYQWTLDQFIGYFNTWSAVQHYKDKEGTDPVKHLREQFPEYGPQTDHVEVNFDIVYRIGRTG